MVFILKHRTSFHNNQVLTKKQMTNPSSEDSEEFYKTSSNQIFNNNDNELIHRKSRHNKERSETVSENSSQISQLEGKNKKENIVTDSSTMNENIVIPNNQTIPYQSHPILSTTTENDSNDCYKLQGEFRRGGWNVAGANILAISCWIAKSQFLYARPRLTGLDFIIAAIITTACGILARYECLPTDYKEIKY